MKEAHSSQSKEYYFNSNGDLVISNCSMEMARRVVFAIRSVKDAEAFRKEVDSLLKEYTDACLARHESRQVD